MNLNLKDYRSTSDSHVNISRRPAKKFKWTYRCRGCGKQLRKSLKICLIRRTNTKISRTHKKVVNIS